MCRSSTEHPATTMGHAARLLTANPSRDGDAKLEVSRPAR
jgi:hypothetical protein